MAAAGVLAITHEKGSRDQGSGRATRSAAFHPKFAGRIPEWGLDSDRVGSSTTRMDAGKPAGCDAVAATVLTLASCFTFWGSKPTTYSRMET